MPDSLPQGSRKSTLMHPPAIRHPRPVQTSRGRHPGRPAAGSPPSFAGTSLVAGFAEWLASEREGDEGRVASQDAGQLSAGGAQLDGSWQPGIARKVNIIVQNHHFLTLLRAVRPGLTEG